MRKITLSKMKFGKFFKTEFAILTVMFLLSFTLHAQDVLLGQYEFTTGDNQLKATNVATGLSMGDAIIDGTKLTANYTGDAVEISNWGTSMNISTGKCINVSITKLANASEFNVGRIDITLKRTTANKLQINFGATTNTYTSKMYSATTLQGTSTYSVISLVEGTGTGAVVVPAVSNSNPLYFSIGTMSASSSEVVYIDKIEVYGTVTLISTPTLSADITSKTINASKNHSVSFPVNLSGANLSGDATISLTGTDPTNFSIDKTSIPVATLTGAPQTITVTYPATTIGTYSATLHIESTGATSLDIPITATCDLFYEDFSNYDASANSSNILSNLLTMTDDVSLAHVPGWSGNKLYQYKAGSPNLGSVCLGSNSTDSAYLTTPEIDLSQPFNLTFKARSLVADVDGRFNVYMDGNQLIYRGVNTTTSLTQQTTYAFVGTSTSKLTFTGRKIDGSEIIFDGIIVNNSSSPAINVALNKVEDFGSVLQGAEKTVDIPVRGYNLEGDLAVSLHAGTNFSITSGSVIDQATATSGANISVKFTAPASSSEISDTLIISSTNFTDRKIAIKATPTVATNISELKESEKIIIHSSSIELIGFEDKKLSVFNISGIKIYETNKMVNAENIDIKDKGCYIINIQESDRPVTRKIVIQ